MKTGKNGFQKNLNFFLQLAVGFLLDWLKYTGSSCFSSLLCPSELFMLSKKFTKKRASRVWDQFETLFCWFKISQREAFQQNSTTTKQLIFRILVFFCLWLIAAVKFALITMVIFFITVVTSMVKGGGCTSYRCKKFSIVSSLAAALCMWVTDPCKLLPTLMRLG